MTTPTQTTETRFRELWEKLLNEGGWWSIAFNRILSFIEEEKERAYQQGKSDRIKEEGLLYPQDFIDEIVGKRVAQAKEEGFSEATLEINEHVLPKIVAQAKREAREETLKDMWQAAKESKNEDVCNGIEKYAKFYQISLSTEGKEK